MTKGCSIGGECLPVGVFKKIIWLSLKIKTGAALRYIANTGYLIKIKKEDYQGVIFVPKIKESVRANDDSLGVNDDSLGVNDDSLAQKDSKVKERVFIPLYPPGIV